MKRKLVLKTEMLRVLTTSRLIGVAGGAQFLGDTWSCGTCGSCTNSQAAICEALPPKQ